MRTVPAALLVALAIAFQALASPLYRAGSITPDFPFLALLYLSFFAAPGDLLLLSAAAAVGIDLVSMDPLGTRLIAYLPPLWIANRLRRGFVVESRSLRAALTFLAASISFLLQGAWLLVREGSWLGTGAELRAAFYTAFLGVAVHGALDRLRPQLGWARDRFFS